MFERFFKSTTTNAHETTETDVRGAQKLQQEGAQLLDVREPDEFASGHAKWAKNIPLGQLAQRLGEIWQNGTVLVICQSGNRSRSAQGLLKRQNIADVRNVRGGTTAWRAAHLPME
jgi:rhodanese-related sulfurtransferase